MNDLSELTDEKLVELFREGDEKASGEIFQRYYQRLCKMAAALYLVGGDREDLIQEGRMGLFAAMGDYDPQAGASFATFATLCIGRAMTRAIEKNNRKKNSPLNESVPLPEDDQSPIDDFDDPEQLLISAERRNELENEIMKALSPMERQVFADLVEGYDYKYIALKLGKSAKSVDNAIQRIRQKVKRIIKEGA